MLSAGPPSSASVGASGSSSSARSRRRDDHRCAAHTTTMIVDLVCRCSAPQILGRIPTPVEIHLLLLRYGFVMWGPSLDHKFCACAVRQIMRLLLNTYIHPFFCGEVSPCIVIVLYESQTYQEWFCCAAAGGPLATRVHAWMRASPLSAVAAGRRRPTAWRGGEGERPRRRWELQGEDRRHGPPDGVPAKGSRWAPGSRWVALSVVHCSS